VEIGNGVVWFIFPLPWLMKIQNQLMAVNNSNVLQGINEGSKQSVPLPTETNSSPKPKGKKVGKKIAETQIRVVTCLNVIQRPRHPGFDQ
jgi:hypothetical protein